MPVDLLTLVPVPPREILHGQRPRAVHIKPRLFSVGYSGNLALSGKSHHVPLGTVRKTRRRQEYTRGGGVTQPLPAGRSPGSIPASIAIRVRAATDATPSFAIRLVRWRLTERSVMPRSLAICLFN